MELFGLENHFSGFGVVVLVASFVEISKQALEDVQGEMSFPIRARRVVCELVDGVAELNLSVLHALSEADYLPSDLLQLFLSLVLF